MSTIIHSFRCFLYLHHKNMIDFKEKNKYYKSLLIFFLRANKSSLVNSKLIDIQKFSKSIFFGENFYP